ATLALAALARGAAAAVAEAPAAGTRARDLYRRALVLDCNCAPPGDGSLPLKPADLERARDSGISVIKFSLGGINDDFASTVAEIGLVQQLCELHPDYFLQVRVPSDFELAKRSGRLGIILSFESAEMLGGRIESLALFRDLGVRVMQLSYN